MNMHKYEKVWMLFGSGTLLVFLIVVGVSAFYMGNKPPSCAVTLDPEEVDTHTLFKEPGLTQIGDNEYQLTIVASAFDYDVGNDEKIIQIPKGATVHVSSTTKDVIHGFEIAGTNVNMMLEPGYISTYTNTFKNAGTYTLVCNEYCGVGHHLMAATIEVIE
ncbi:cytochrome c oxidase subunit II [Pseudogracilibacillus auburnensis]|uniref:Cytochrome aa3 subunit 2 n=1 Tax=Pseudogracilibacillus auburnensis TaxID=1494959 RepID=A0A2V3VTE8_9BACI|nr:cytochrome c oxidase subunit II [Pseudogracilibacillus auburnensis]MBO1004620.1 cytochrome c oxidase subunit II [Pseudogracilibacillus auburnensis]PXW85172.1 cytochrome c oxidase subunit 2 [Pseudogracilibacillus auburnensis]